MWAVKAREFSTKTADSISFFTLPCSDPVGGWLGGGRRNVVLGSSAVIGSTQAGRRFQWDSLREQLEQRKSLASESNAST
jgi:hypothetical protein